MYEPPRLSARSSTHKKHFLPRDGGGSTTSKHTLQTIEKQGRRSSGEHCMFTTPSSDPPTLGAPIQLPYRDAQATEQQCWCLVPSSRSSGITHPWITRACAASVMPATCCPDTHSSGCRVITLDHPSSSCTKRGGGAAGPADAAKSTITSMHMIIIGLSWRLLSRPAIHTPQLFNHAEHYSAGSSPLH